jgi:hypothetical protein
MTKTIIVTPAGRKRYLEILLNNLLKQKNDFSVWQLWLNTDNQDDIDYCKSLEQEYDWIKCYDLDIPFAGNISIHTFFKYTTEKDHIYIRLDDDIVYFEKDFVRKMSSFRIKNPEPFLIYANIINNAICDHIHQRIGALPHSVGQIGHSCFDNVGWQSGLVAEQKHNVFFDHMLKGTLNVYKFSPQWILKVYSPERCSINAISWLGSRFAEFEGKVGSDEEQWLSVDKPIADNAYNTICGDALCVHYAFYTQRDHVDACPHILNKYREISNL